MTDVNENTMDDLFAGTGDDAAGALTGPTPAQKAAATRKRNKAIKAAQVKADIEQEGIPEPVVEEKISSKRPSKKLGPKVRILIQNEVGHPNYKFVGINGTGFQIKRGEEVIVPQAVVDVLYNAKATRLVQDADGNRILQEYLATPFQVLGPAED